VPLKAREKSRPREHYRGRTARRRPAVRKVKEGKHRKGTRQKHPPFADSAKSGAPEKSEGRSELNRRGHPPTRQVAVRRKRGKEQPEKHRVKKLGEMAAEWYGTSWESFCVRAEAVTYKAGCGKNLKFETPPLRRPPTDERLRSLRSSVQAG